MSGKKNKQFSGVISPPNPNGLVLNKPMECISQQRSSLDGVYGPWINLNPILDPILNSVLGNISSAVTPMVTSWVVRHRRHCTSICGWAFRGGDGSALTATAHWPTTMQMQQCRCKAQSQQIDHAFSPIDDKPIIVGKVRHFPIGSSATNQ